MKKEDQNIEYKQSWRDEYLKWVCGFANADGGRMLIGVMDDKKGNAIVGVTDWKSLLETIPNQMRDTIRRRYGMKTDCTAWRSSRSRARHCVN